MRICALSLSLSAAVVYELLVLVTYIEIIMYLVVIRLHSKNVMLMYHISLNSQDKLHKKVTKCRNE